MSVEVCGYHSFWYCKEKTSCQKYHSNEDCENTCKEKLVSKDIEGRVRTKIIVIFLSKNHENSSIRFTIKLKSQN